MSQAEASAPAATTARATTAPESWRFTAAMLSAGRSGLAPPPGSVALTTIEGKPMGRSGVRRYLSSGVKRYLIRAFTAPKPSRQVIFFPSSGSRPAYEIGTS